MSAREASERVNSATADRTAVRAAFNTYARAALDQDGATAVSTIASPIFGFYDQARELAVTGTEGEIRQQTVTQQMTVYLLRAELDPAVLSEGSVEEILTVVFDYGLVDTGEFFLGDIQVDGDQASAETMLDGETTDFELPFLREEGAWKVDIEPLLSFADEGLRREADRLGISTDVLIEDVLVSRYGQSKADGLHVPLAD